MPDTSPNAPRRPRPYRARTADGAGPSLPRQQARPGVERHEVGRLEVRKRIVIEELTVTVPMRREVLEVVRIDADGEETPFEVPESVWEPRVENRTGPEQHSTPANDVAVPHAPVPPARPRHAAPGANDAADAGTVEIVLHEERPVITTEVFAIERVTVSKTTLADPRAVNGEEHRDALGEGR